MIIISLMQRARALVDTVLCGGICIRCVCVWLGDHAAWLGKTSTDAKKGKWSRLRRGDEKIIRRKVREVTKKVLFEHISCYYTVVSHTNSVQYWRCC